MVNQKCFKSVFQLIRSSTKIIEFDHVKFPEYIKVSQVYYLKMVFKANFLRLNFSNSMFSKKLVLQKRKCPYPYFQSISYNNVVVT